MRLEDGQVSLATEADKLAYAELKRLFEVGVGLDSDFWNWPLVGYVTNASLRRLLNLNFIYDLQLKSSGSIVEFGVHHGSSFVQLINLRSIKEPFNQSRHIYGFDTFSGFEGVTENDGSARIGDFSVPSSFEPHLQRLCDLHESLGSLRQLKRFSLIKGNAPEMLGVLLDERRDLVISLAIFDMDIYKPTKEAIEMILPRLHRGSILVFDEFNCPYFPGETQAVAEVLGLNNFEFIQSPFLSYTTICKFR